MRIWKLKKCCCCCIDLRLGCAIIYVIEFFFAVCGICLGRWSKENPLWVLGRLGYMMHLIGTVALLMGILMKSPGWLLAYLVTNIVHIFTSLAYIILWTLQCSFCVYMLTLSSFGIVCSIYFWLIVFSYRSRCIWESSPDYDENIVH